VEDLISEHILEDQADIFIDGSDVLSKTSSGSPLELYMDERLTFLFQQVEVA
jgi:hypothetical protein